MKNKQSYIIYEKILIIVIALLFNVFCSFFTVHCFSQGVAVNNTVAPADNSAILDISSTSQGLLIPRMTTAQRDAISSPSLSLLIFNTTTNCFEAYVNGLWYSVSCPYSCICSQMQMSYGGTGQEQGRDIRITSDGGYIIAGVTTSFGAGSWDFYLLKTDCYGNLVWNRTFGGTGTESAASLDQTSDGGYIMAGVSDSFGAGNSDFYLVKTDESGNFIWNKTYGGTKGDYATSVQQTKDGGYIIAGFAESFSGEGQDAYLVKTDGSGNLSWSRNFGGSGPGPEIFSSLQQTSDGGYIMAGYTENFGAGAGDVFLVKTDGSGNLSWSKTYGGTGQDWARSVQQTADGGYIMAGSTQSFGAGGDDCYLLKTDESGNLSWSRTFGGIKDESIYSVRQTSDGGYIMASQTTGFGAEVYNLYVVKADGSGNLAWSITIGGTRIASALSVQQTVDGGYVTAGGTSKTTGVKELNVFLLKTDASGNGGGCETTTPATIVTSPVTQVGIAIPTVTIPATIVGNPTPTITNPTPTVNKICSWCK
jgi:hypothetical protein